MRIQSMKSSHKCRKMRGQSETETEGWKTKKIPASYNKNLSPMDSPLTPAEFEASLEYMNEWLNHPLYPKFI